MVTLFYRFKQICMLCIVSLLILSLTVYAQDKKKKSDAKAPPKTETKESAEAPPKPPPPLKRPVIKRGSAKENYKLSGNALNEIVKYYEQKNTGPYQVMIEVIIFEVFIRNQDQIGFVYDILGRVGEFRGMNLAGDPNIESNLSVLGSGSRNELLPAGVNIVSNIFESNDENRVQATIQALAEDQIVQVYSNPRILTMNGVPARLETGEEIPFLERKNLGNTETFTTNFRKTGVTLYITPTVEFAETDINREKPIIITDLDVSLSSISRFREEEGFTQPIIDTRDLNTVVPLRLGQRIIIASLYRDTQVNTMRGVPILKDVPFLGRLFRGTTDENRVSQLFVLIRPDLYNYQGEQFKAAGTVTNPEQQSKEFRQLLDQRTKELEGRTGYFEEFQELFIDRDSPQ